MHTDTTWGKWRKDMTVTVCLYESLFSLFFSVDEDNENDCDDGDDEDEDEDAF